MRPQTDLAEYYEHDMESLVTYLVFDGLPVFRVADDRQLKLGHLLHFSIHVDLL